MYTANNTPATPSTTPNEPPSKEDTPGKFLPGISRRAFTLGTGGVFVLLGLGGLTYLSAKPSLRPPGGQNEDHLIAACIRCERCIEACPRNVLMPAHIEDSILSIRTPVLDFSNNYCNWCLEENKGIPQCAQACPTQALKLPSDATPENTIIGKAVTTEEWCLAYKLIGCKFCYDACPYNAIELDEKERPIVIEEKCNGCGACEAACVSLKNASIATGATSKAITVCPKIKA